MFKIFLYPLLYLAKATVLGLSFAALLHGLLGVVYIFLVNIEFTQLRFNIFIIGLSVFASGVFLIQFKTSLIQIHPKWKFLTKRDIVSLLIGYVLIFLLVSIQLIHSLNTGDQMDLFKFYAMCIVTSNVIVICIISSFNYKVTKAYINKYGILFNISRKAK